MAVNGAQKPSRPSLERAAETFDALTDVLGLCYNRQKNEVDDDIEALVEKRQQARKDRDFATADAIRDQLAAMGITLKDTADGVQIIRK